MWFARTCSVTSHCCSSFIAPRSQFSEGIFGVKVVLLGKKVLQGIDERTVQEMVE